ncbi:hypothetical protein C7447_102147 [Tenacibaculum adriaticum]|uniref:Outer membrane protein with beta-barrel domain n=1 Tax=Tenacibaculum adriaticum TaxID=413713 RepID=A0A5S5DSG8_9FLAO|nr:hypothetical protein [Tenacibaculum adriaticum]TYP98831.1 hypothetical protein C7447_102147 [Tenacibaculum adriaticum]
MKKILLLTFLNISIQVTSQQQFNIGINGGITIGNIEPVSKMAFGGDINYLFDISDEFVVGPSLGLVFFSSKEANGEKSDAKMYLPISTAIRFNSNEDVFYVGADLGFAVGLSPEGDNGGVFFKPLVGYKINQAFKVNLFYAGIKKRKPTYAFIGLGLVYDFNAGKDDFYFY